MIDTAAEASIIDRDHLRDMREVLGAERSVVILRSLLSELSDAPATIARHIAADEFAAARAAAHRLRGVALGLGCTHVASVSARIETGACTTLADGARDLCAAAAITAEMISRQCDREVW